MSVAAIPAILTVGSTIFSAMGQMDAGKVAQQQANQQAYMAQVQGQIAANQAASQQNMMNFQAEQLEIAAGQERAMAQRRGIEQLRRLRNAQSRATAVAAASGGGLDGNVIDILGDLEEEGRYNYGSAIYEGETAARSAEDSARLRRLEGQGIASAGMAQMGINNAAADMYRWSGANERRAANNKAFTTILSGAGAVAGSNAGQSLLSKYG